MDEKNLPAYNYELIKKTMPEVFTNLGEEYIYRADGSKPFTVKMLPDNQFTIGHYRMNGKQLVIDPEIKIKLDSTAKTAEALSYTISPYDKYGLGAGGLMYIESYINDLAQNDVTPGRRH